MDRKRLLSIIFATLCVWWGFCHADNVPLHSPVGYWKTLDDTTGKPKSIIQIWKTENNILMGKVIKIFNENENYSPKCLKCKGDKLNQPIVGMVVLSGLKSQKKQWMNGEILDPENGKVYSCNLRTLENGKRLQVRGYLGLPLLGRSQTWERVDLMSG